MAASWPALRLGGAFLKANGAAVRVLRGASCSSGGELDVASVGHRRLQLGPGAGCLQQAAYGVSMGVQGGGGTESLCLPNVRQGRDGSLVGQREDSVGGAGRYFRIGCMEPSLQVTWAANARHLQKVSESNEGGSVDGEVDEKGKEDGSSVAGEEEPYSIQDPRFLGLAGGARL